MVSKEKATHAMVVELVSINPVHLRHTATANVSFPENHRKYSVPCQTNGHTQRRANCIGMVSDPLTCPCHKW